MFYIVLANWMTHCGKMNADSERRVDMVLSKAVPLQDSVLFLGLDYLDGCSITVARAMRDLFLSKTNEYFDLHMEENSRDTVGDAVYACKYFEKIGYNGDICVVTSNYHVERTAKIFDFVFFGMPQVKVLGASSKEANTVSSEQQSLEAFRNTFQNVSPGDVHKIAETLCNSHPFYNGEIYEQVKPIIFTRGNNNT